MRCYNGISVKGSLVPCGQCLDCRINKTRGTAAKILLEQAVTYERYGLPSYFLTQTYNDEHLPRTPDGLPTLRKQEYLADLKAVKRSIGGVRTFAVGEYGDDSMRPHYHMVVFPDHPAKARAIADSWQYGFTTLDELTPRRARYIAGYAAKKLTSSKDSRLKGGQEPEFAAWPARPGLGVEFHRTLVQAYRTSGAAYLQENGDIARTVRISGQIYPIPRTILDKTRARLGIPLRHADRLQHDGYYQQYAHADFAEQDKELSRCNKVKRHAETTQRKRRTTTQTI